MSLSSASSGSLARGGVVALAALIALALILRSPLTAVAPIVNALRQELNIGAAATGALTSIPVLCFGLLAPAASWLIARTSVETGIFVTLGGAAAGMALRSGGGVDAAFTGTFVLGAALTVGNIVALMVVARDFPRRIGMVTGIYTSALNIGTMLTSAVTEPIAEVAGWRLALAAAAVLVFPATGLWLAVVRRTPPVAVVRASGAAASMDGPAWRRPLVWLLGIAFAAHLCVYYSLTAWLPAFLTERAAMSATEAGLVASLFQILALIGSFGCPLLTGRVSLPILLVGVAACWFVTPLGFLWAPQGWLVWSVLGGIASGGGFVVIFSLIMSRARNLDDNRQISALVQGGGYTLSALGPMAVGSLRQATQGWFWGLSLLAVAAVIMAAAGLGVVRLPRPRPVERA